VPASAVTPGPLIEPQSAWNITLGRERTKIRISRPKNENFFWGGALPLPLPRPNPNGEGAPLPIVSPSPYLTPTYSRRRSLSACGVSILLPSALDSTWPPPKPNPGSGSTLMRRWNRAADWPWLALDCYISCCGFLLVNLVVLTAGCRCIYI